MLGRLMKYEFKATSRRIIPVMIIMAALALINRIMVPIFLKSPSRGVHNLHMLFDGMLTAAYLALAVTAFLMLIARFYKNILGDEGYTTMTLPVGESQLLWSKLLSSLIWAIVIGFIMGVVLFIRSGNVAQVADFIHEISTWDILGACTEISWGDVIGYFFELLLFCSIMFLDACLAVYCALTLGHMFKKHKILMAAVIFALITILMVMLFFNLVLQTDCMLGDITCMNESSAVSVQIHLMALICIIAAAIPGAAMYTATYLGLKKNLNLE